MLTLNLISLYDSDIKYKRSTFSDGQPHIKILGDKLGQMPEDVQIIARITNPKELFEVVMVGQIFKGRKHLVVSYLMGGRMDRAISESEPFTLETVADILDLGDWSAISLFDPHSIESAKQLSPATVFYPDDFIESILEEETILVCPDEGAHHRVSRIARETGNRIFACSKTRDSENQALSNFRANSDFDITGKRMLIVDDICDGGRTFTGIAKLLRELGAAQVDLFVTHGIFSYGYDIGINNIYTTNSYRDFKNENIEYWEPHVKIFDCNDLLRGIDT